MTTENETEDDMLTDVQRARCEALAIARACLCDSGASPITSRDSLPKRFGAKDLILLAEWILGSGHTITVVVVPDDAVEEVSRLNPAENFRPGGLLIVPESADTHRVSFEREATE